MGVLICASLLWDANQHSQEFSRVYTEEWAEKLFRGFDRNLTVPHRNVLFTDRARKLSGPIEQLVLPDLGVNGYGDCIRPFMLDEPMILVGLDTIIVGDIDHLAAWCMEAERIALPNPYGKLACNGVALVPSGKRAIYDDWRGENDMEWLRRQPHETIDAIWPGQVVSYKAHVRGRGLGPDARIVYFHGRPKMTDIDEPFVRQHWI